MQVVFDAETVIALYDAVTVVVHFVVVVTMDVFDVELLAVIVVAVGAIVVVGAVFGVVTMIVLVHCIEVVGRMIVVGTMVVAEAIMVAAR